MTELARESWKKALSFLLVLVAVFMMAGCGNTQSLSFKTPAGEKLESSSTRRMIIRWSIRAIRSSSIRRRKSC